MVGVFFSVLRKCNLGRLFLRPDMVFFVCYCGCVCCEKLGCFSFFCDELVFCFDS